MSELVGQGHFQPEVARVAIQDQVDLLCLRVVKPGNVLTKGLDLIPRQIVVLLDQAQRHVELLRRLHFFQMPRTRIPVL